MTTLGAKQQIRLRAMEPEDLDWLYKIENDITLWNVGATNVPYSRYALHDYIANAANDIYIDKQVRLIIDDGLGVPVGVVDLVNFDPRHLRAEVGIVIESKYRRCGYAAMALREVAAYASDVLHLHQLYAVVAETNVVSARLFECMGYTGCGRLKDWLFDGKKFVDAKVLQVFL